MMQRFCSRRTVNRYGENLKLKKIKWFNLRKPVDIPNITLILVNIIVFKSALF